MSEKAGLEVVPTARIWVLGLTGHGRTSLCNAMTGEREKVLPGFVSATKEVHASATVRRGSRSYIFVDTPGAGCTCLNKAETFSRVEGAVNRLGRPDLVIVTHRQYSPLSAALVSFWDSFKRLASAERQDFAIPLILMFTECENHGGDSTDSEKDLEALREKGFDPSRLIYGYLGDPANSHEEARPYLIAEKEKTVQALWAGIETLLPSRLCVQARPDAPVK